MAHPATLRASLAQVRAITSPIDIGAIHSSGRAIWLGRAVDLRSLQVLLPRFASENARGANIYVRIFLDPGWNDDTAHPGVILLDDLTPESLSALSKDGIIPLAVVETSAANFQAWIRIASAGEIDCSTARRTARFLAERYGADLKAVAAAQPGRLAGFTNRKEKHRKSDGRFPFCRLISTAPDSVMPERYIARSRPTPTQPRPAGRALRETPPGAAIDDQASFTELTRIWEIARFDVMRQVEIGCRRPEKASLSEVDFRAAVIALRRDFAPDLIEAFLASDRPEKSSAYPVRTIEAAKRFLGNMLAADIRQLGP